MLQLLSAVDHMHKHWYIHRDLKTSNLLYSNKGKLAVCDFGMARKYGRWIYVFLMSSIYIYVCVDVLVLSLRILLKWLLCGIGHLSCCLDRLFTRLPWICKHFYVEIISRANYYDNIFGGKVVMWLHLRRTVTSQASFSRRGGAGSNQQDIQGARMSKRPEVARLLYSPEQPPNKHVTIPCQVMRI